MMSLLRQFRQTPLTLLSCIAVLAIGICGATVAFSALYTIVLHPLPYPNPQQLVAVHSQFPRLQMDHLGVSPLDYLDLRQDQHLFSDAAAFFYLDLSRTGQLHAEKVHALAITSSLLATFGVGPRIGRSFQPVEEQPGGPHVGGLLVLRSAQRAFETSVRLALGAGNGRIARHALLETALLCACGGIAGAAIAVPNLRLLNYAGRFGHLQLSVPVLLFGICLTIAAATLSCLYPLWRVVRANPLDAMKSAGHRRTASHHRQYTRRILVIVQVAASTALLIAGRLLLHTYARLLQTPLGFEPDHVMTMQISLPPLRYASASSQRTFYQTVLDRIRHVPGIRDASACTVLPFGYGENMEPFALPGQPARSAQQLASVNNVMPRFFETLRLPLLAGRYFNSDDTPGHPGVVIVNRYLADHYFGPKNAIGEQIQMGDRRFSIIGVVGNIKVAGLDVSDAPILYLSAAQMPRTDMSLVVKSDSESGVQELVQSIVSQIDRDQPVYDVAPLQSRIDASLATRRFVAFLLASFSGLGIVITALGLYGLLSYSVLLRRQEFGIRAAVGASPRHLSLLIVTQGMRLIALGTLPGSAIALAAGRFLSSQISDVRIADLATWLSVAATLILVGLISSTVPAWRASRANPASLIKEN